MRERAVCPAGSPVASRDLLIVACLLLLMVLRLLSGGPPRIQLEYWYLSYSEGFVRRGLIGTFMMPWLTGLPLMDAMRAISRICAAADLALVATLAFILRSREMLPIFALFLGSSALSTLGRDLGLLDGFVILFSLLAFLLLRRNNKIGVLLCLLVPLIHEGGVFILLPLLGGLAALRDDRRAFTLLGAAGALASSAALWFFATNDFVWPAGMPPLDPRELPRFAEWQLGQRDLTLVLPPITLDIAVFSIFLSVVIAGFVTWRRGPVAGMIVLGGTLATWSVSLIAFDTDRLFAWGPFTAAILAWLAIQPRPDSLENSSR